VSRSVETVIVGAGQAGLALSRCLTDAGREHVLLERGRVGERWRSERWDSFHLLTPAWHTRLPGHRYDGPDPDAFLDQPAVVRLFERYAASFGAPVMDHTTVSQVRPDRDRWRVVADRAELLATNVVVATGPHDLPVVPPLAAELPHAIDQLHARDYRNPDQLRDGGVLVVGAGPTGQQLASELARAGRTVHLAVGRHQRLPRTYRGRDAFWWLEQLGTSEQTIDEVAVRGRRPRPVHPVLTANRELGLDVLVGEGVVTLGRLRSIDGWRLTFDDDLGLRYLEAEAAASRFAEQVDRVVAATAMDVPAAPPRTPLQVPGWAAQPSSHLDLRAAGVRTVLWATGYRRDFRWLQAPVLDDAGEPVHRRGITAAPGLTFLGLTWLYRRKSASIDGVGDDARYLAAHLAARSDHQRKAA
jgi:putative flavoprotein involved in K+ transport